MKERRQYPRVSVDIPCKAHIIFPEDTFQPKEFEGRIFDLNIKGARIYLYNVPQDTFIKCLKKPGRYMKIVFNYSDIGHTKLIGKMIWYDYQSEHNDLNSGVYFEEITEKEQNIIKEILDSSK